MSTTRDSNPPKAYTINASCTSTSGPWHGRQRSLWSTDPFDHPEVVHVIRQARLDAARPATACRREGTERAQVRCLAVQRVIGTSRPRNRYELRVDGLRLCQQGHFP